MKYFGTEYLQTFSGLHFVCSCTCQCILEELVEEHAPIGREDTQTKAGNIKSLCRL